MRRPRRERAVHDAHEEDAFATRDAFGLTPDDWASFQGGGPAHYTGPAMLFWALAGIFDQERPFVMSSPIADLLASLTADARALATLAASSTDENLRTLAWALRNHQRRLATATEMAVRMAVKEGGASPRAEALAREALLPTPC